MILQAGMCEVLMYLMVNSEISLSIFLASQAMVPRKHQALGACSFLTMGSALGSVGVCFGSAEHV